MISRKHCNECKAYKFLDVFYKSKTSKDGHVSRCKECYKKKYINRTPEEIEKAKEYQKQHKKAHRKDPRKIGRDLYIKYGIKETDYNRILASQKGNCAICGNPPTSERRLCVDHDHRTGEVRGLLCNKCNFAIGYLDDNYDSAIVLGFYLMSHDIKPHRKITHQEFVSHASGYLSLFHSPLFTNKDMQERRRLAQLTPIVGDTVRFKFGPYIFQGLVVKDCGSERNLEQFVRVRVEPIDKEEPLETEIPARVAKVISTNRQP